MSEIDELTQLIATAIGNAGDAQTASAGADEFCTRITTSGAGIGFGNDPQLVHAAQEKVQLALGSLGNVVVELGEANTLVQQAASLSTTACG